MTPLDRPSTPSVPTVLTQAVSEAVEAVEQAPPRRFREAIAVALLHGANRLLATGSPRAMFVAQSILLGLAAGGSFVSWLPPPLGPAPDAEMFASRAQLPAAAADGVARR